jgi:hypothetical protein
MKREQLQARCDPDTVEAVKEYQERKDITKSEAVRRLIRTGLDAKAREEEHGPVRRAGQSGILIMILVIAILSFVLQFTILAGGTL